MKKLRAVINRTAIQIHNLFFMYIKVVPHVPFNMHTATKVLNLVNAFVDFWRAVEEARAQIFYGCDGWATVSI